MEKKLSKLEIKGRVKKYLSIGVQPSAIARILGMSRQAVHYWVKEIRKEKWIHPMKNSKKACHLPEKGQLLLNASNVTVLALEKTMIALESVAPYTSGHPGAKVSFWSKKTLKSGSFRGRKQQIRRQYEEIL